MGLPVHDPIPHMHEMRCLAGQVLWLHDGPAIGQGELTILRQALQDAHHFQRRLHCENDQQAGRLGAHYLHRAVLP